MDYSMHQQVAKCQPSKKICNAVNTEQTNSFWPYA